MANIPYSSAVDSLMYTMVCTRVDITDAVVFVSRYLSNLAKMHWEAVKGILRYLRAPQSCACSLEMASQFLKDLLMLIW